jgi:hypothetical protein
MNRLDEFLEHSGVKGMKWGVRHDEHAAVTKGDKPEKPKGKLSTHLDSLKRERQWKNVIRELDNMSTKDIKFVSKRIELENDLKKYSKSPVANKAEKQYYLNRHNMSNEEMARKITRLKAKVTLHDNIGKASKEQREFGIKIVQTASSVGLKYATTRTKLKPADFLDAYKNPTIKTRQNAWDKGMELVEPKVTNPKAKSALNVAKTVVSFKTNDKPKS